MPIKEKMKEVIGICKKVRPKAFYILLNGLDVIGRWEDNLKKLQYWYIYTKEIGRL